jgi:hypothetical protein
VVGQPPYKAAIAGWTAVPVNRHLLWRLQLGARVPKLAAGFPFYTTGSSFNWLGLAAVTNGGGVQFWRKFNRHLFLKIMKNI